MNIYRILIKLLQKNRFHQNYSMQIISLWILLTLLTISCNSSTLDSNFFADNKSCQPPCWNEIVPGLTVENDAVAILQNSEHISPDSVIEKDLLDTTVNHFTFRLTEGSHGGVKTRNDLVFEIYLSPEFNLTLMDVIDRFGEPDYVFSQDSHIGELVCFDTYFYYPNRGIMVQFNECRKHFGSDHPSVISGDELIDNVVYFPASTKTYEEFLLEIWQPHEEIVRFISINSEIWRGFGVYNPNINSGLSGIP